MISLRRVTTDPIEMEGSVFSYKLEQDGDEIGEGTIWWTHRRNFKVTIELKGRKITLPRLYENVNEARDALEAYVQMAITYKRQWR